MRVSGIIWLRDVVDTLLWKHQVTTDEVESIFESKPRFRLIAAGDVEANTYMRHWASQLKVDI